MADDILSNAEIENIVENFTVSTIEEIGTFQWFSDRDKIYKIYQVALLEGNTQDTVERVTAAVVNFSKIEAFVKELLTLSIWKEKLLPQLFKVTPHPEQAFPTYIILYSEVIMIGVIQTLLFHNQLHCDLGDLCLDLIDYAVTQITRLDPTGSFNTFLKDMKLESQGPNTDIHKEIKAQKAIMNYDIGTCCISILRYIAENFENAPLSVASRMYNTHDVPIILAHLIDKETWTKREDGKTYKYEQSKWREWKLDDPFLSAIECQVWLLMRQLLLNSSCDSVYYFSNYRKEQLSKLVRHLHDRIVDQLSPLADLKLWLHRLSISDTSSEKTFNSLIIDVSTQFRESLCNEYEEKWSEIATKKAKFLFSPNKSEVVKIAKGFANSLDGIEKVCEELNNCTVCFQKATKRCSKCKNAWYCSRRCQVNHWALHRKVCCI